MKKILIYSSLFLIMIIAACKGKKSTAYVQYSQNLDTMINELNTRFSNNPEYYSIMFSFDEVFGNTILVKIAENIDSAKIHEWFYISGKWEMTSEKTLEEDSLNISNLFFNIKDEYEISKLPGLLEIATEKLEDDKDVEISNFKSINLLMGDQDPLEHKMDNLITQITIESAPDKKPYFIYFDVNGNFLSISE